MSDGATLAASQPSAGVLLRQAREGAGLHLAALAGVLKVPQRQLEALEQDRLDVLPDVVYARALAASVCRNLGMDPQMVLSRLPKGGDSRLGQDEPMNVPFRPPGDAAGSLWRVLLGRPPVLIALAAFLGAVVLLLLPLIPNQPALQESEPMSEPMRESLDQQTQVQAVQAGSVPEPVAAPVSAGATVEATAPAPAAASDSGSQSAVSPSASASASESAAAAAAPTIEFQASRPSWVQVVDARGVVHLRRELAAGERASVSGATAPLSVIVGSARSTQVRVRGASFDLVPHARDNVARFEVR